jgi:tetratricopeptide (TPR) repeat protein
MKRASWVLAGSMILAGADAPAQFFFSNSVAAGPFAGSRSFSSVHIGPHRSFTGYYYRWYFPNNYYSYWYWGYPYLGADVYYSNPTIVIYPPAPAAAQRQPEGEAAKGKPPRKQEAAGKANPEPPLPGKEAGAFRQVQPEDRARALQPVPPEPPKPAEAAPPAPEPLKEPLPVPVDLVSRGKQAFAAQEYGRAERLFRKMAEKEPQNPLGYFLLAQAQFALAKYDEAARSIDAGLRLQPDWPNSEFRTILLYGNHQNDFQEQLDHLHELVDQKPSDPVLLFVFAHQLWFAKRRNEAKPIFERAKEVTSDKTGIDLFLQAK